MSSVLSEMPAVLPEPAAARPATKLCYIQPSTAERLGADLERAAALGFDTVVIPPVFQAVPVGGVPVASDFDAAAKGHGVDSAHEAVRKLAALARRHGLGVLMDVRVDQLTHQAAQRAGPLFARRPLSSLDPRQAPGLSEVAFAQVASSQDAAGLGEFWSDLLRGWQSAGLAGFRLLGLPHFPAEHLARFASGLRGGCPGALLFAWTPGMEWDAVGKLAGAADLVASSLPWWDWTSDWLWDELRMLRRVAPVVACADAPDGPYLARAGSTPEDVDALHRLGSHLAAVLTECWMAQVANDPANDIDAECEALNRLRAGPDGAVFGGATIPLTAPGDGLISVLRTDAADARASRRALLALFNADPHLPRSVHPAQLLPHAGGGFSDFEAALPSDGTLFDPAYDVPLAPAAARFYTSDALPVRAPSPLRHQSGEDAARQPRLAIERAAPSVDGGRFPVKRTLGELIAVEADVIADGHDVLGVALRWKEPGHNAWHETPMRPLGNDRWTAGFPLRSLGVHHYQVLAWRDAFATFRDELSKKYAAGVPVSLELREGTGLVEAAAGHAQGEIRTALTDALRPLRAADPDACRDTLLSDSLAALMRQADPRPHLVELDRPVPVRAERTAAGFASWYEVFPRSLSDDPARHGTFADVERHLPRIRDMGFDVLYFPPIHPIGLKNRKGRNNTLTPSATDPGSPYAIGSEDGGHDALHPELGTFEEFERLRLRAAEHGLELAIDFAIQCSPDHPWLREHEDWFNWRPDGTIRYAENPPKKYEDIVNVDFYAPGAVPGLWLALCEVVLFWAGRGVRLFRVDNPHTKPMPFWEWMIGEVQARYPDAAFLSEAFTRPKVMYRLAKAGFSQSYTYFTWRNTRAEFEQYLTELTQEAPRDFFRPHFFVNTPDINPVFLQESGRPGHLIRAALAATLSGLWGVYNGFELCEATPMPGKEEYLDSEKYEIRAWDWDRPGNIVAEITQLNAIRKLNPALHSHLGVTFLRSGNDQVLCFEKASPDRANVLLIAISLDPARPQSASFELPAGAAAPGGAATMDIEDLLTGRAGQWSGARQPVTLSLDRPYAIWRIRPTA